MASLSPSPPLSQQTPQGKHASDFDTSVRCLYLGRLNLHESATESANRISRTSSDGTGSQSNRWGARGGPLFIVYFVKYSKPLHGKRQKARPVLHSKPTAISQEKVGLNDLEKGKGVYGDQGVSKTDCAESSRCLISAAGRPM